MSIKGSRFCIVQPLHYTVTFVTQVSCKSATYVYASVWSVVLCLRVERNIPCLRDVAGVGCRVELNAGLRRALQSWTEKV